MTFQNTQAAVALLRESRLYFREIGSALERWAEDPGADAQVAQARKRLRTIGGAAGMIGLEGLAGAAKRLHDVLAAEVHQPGRGEPTNAGAGFVVRPLMQCTRLLESHLEELSLGRSGGKCLRAAESQLEHWRVSQAFAQARHAHVSEQFVDVFREEAWTHLGAITKGLRQLRNHLTRPERLDEARSALHTLKGAAGVIGLYDVSRLAHELEDLIEAALGQTGASAGNFPETQTELADVFHRLARSCGVPVEDGLAPAWSCDEAAIYRRQELRAESNDEPHVRLPRKSLQELELLSAALAEVSLPADTNLARLHARVVAAVAKMRSAPFATIEDRLQRTAQTVAQRLGKQVVVEFHGGEADVERAMLDALIAPLEHLLRNSVDHGLEDAAIRVAAGKPAAGRICIRTCTLDGQWVVEVADDGAGLSASRIRRKAVERGILPLEEVLALSEAETLRLAFAAGLSTANQVSEISGRGMGLAIVKETVGRLGGHCAVESKRGEGTTFRLVVPISTSVTAPTRILEVHSGNEVYAVPAAAVVRVLRLAQGQLEWLSGRPMLLLEGEYIPAFYLDQELGLDSCYREPSAQSPVLLVEHEGQTVACIVDQIGGMPEATIRGLDGVINLVGKPKGISGVVLTGDRARLVLDVRHLVERSAWASAGFENAYFESKAS